MCSRFTRRLVCFLLAVFYSALVIAQDETPAVFSTDNGNTTTNVKSIKSESLQALKNRDRARYLESAFEPFHPIEPKYIGYEPASTVDVSCLSEYGDYEIVLFNPRCGEDGERLWSQTKLMFGLGFGIAGAIWLMPEDISGWDTDDKTRPTDKWWDNVSSGPVWDTDDWFLNWVGHPYFGGVYYQAARKSGYNQWNSFMYGFLMSTLYWEYGLEAFAEKPSIQDLIITPLGGWIYGEWAYRKELSILENDSRVWGSRFVGGVALFFLDPVDRIGMGINGLVGREWIKTGRVAITRVSPVTSSALSFFQVAGAGEMLIPQYENDYLGLIVQLEF